MKGVAPRCWILALIIREDKERLLLGDGAFMFNKKQQHFAANKVTSTVIDVQGSNGSLLAGQTMKAANQTFEGYIGDAGVSKEEIEVLRRQFLNFFKLNMTYEVVYVMPDGSAVKRQRGFVVNAPEVQELWQIHPEYSVSLNFEDVNYYKYEEDDVTGEEIYGQSATILLYNAITGGFTWDDKGLVWDTVGAVTAPGKGGTTTVKIDSVAQVYPIWTINGLSDDPILENLTTGQKIQYKGRVSPGQVLEIDMLNHTATLDGTNVVQNVTGTWLSFAPGANRINYITENNNAPNSNIKWAEVVM